MAGIVSTVMFLQIRRLLGMAGLSGRLDDKDIEIVLLRQQLAALRRQGARPRYAPSDRMLLATWPTCCPGAGATDRPAGPGDALRLRADRL